MTTTKYLPAYIRLKFSKKCSTCNLPIEANGLAFYIGATKQVFHGKCGKPEWKVSGSPYAIRQQAAMAHQKANAETITEDTNAKETEEG